MRGDAAKSSADARGWGLRSAAAALVAVAGIAWGLFAGDGWSRSAIAGSPDCASTEPQVEGPYYLAGSPLRSNLVEPGDGPLLTISGRVLDTECQPIPNCWIDVWHTDTTGSYDLVSGDYRYRGHFFTDELGEFVLETIVPGLYPGRTAHLHVKVEGDGTPLLTTQLYLPDHPLNATDLYYTPALEVTAIDTSPGGDLVASFDFVLPSSCTAPTVQEGPVSQSCPAGEPVSLAVGATGSGPVTFEWWRDGSPLGDGPEWTGSSSSTLTILDWGVAHAGVYECRVTNSCGEAWSVAAEIGVTGAAEFIRGDCARDGGVDLGDMVAVLALLFGSGVAPCLDACDVNDDSALDVADAVYGLSFLFLSGTSPPAPTSSCGFDPSPDSISCHGVDTVCAP